MKLQINIQHHPSRQRHLSLLINSLDAGYDRIITDDQGTWSGCRKALADIKKGTTHILVLQDDVIVCRDFKKTVEKIIELLPDETITFFSNRPVVKEAHKLNKSWAQLTTFFMAQAYLMPVKTAMDFVAFADLHTKPNHNIDDEKLGLYFFFKKQRVWATSPSLVEHIGFSNTTITQRKNEERYFDPARRVANYFIGIEKSGLDIDWTKGIDTPLLDDWGKWDMFCDNYRP